LALIATIVIGTNMMPFDSAFFIHSAMRAIVPGFAVA
jgi:hypothetical protein